MADRGDRALRLQRPARAGRPAGPPAREAALLGIATGVLFGLSAALTKAVGDQFEEGVFTIFADWHTYALLVVGYASMTLSQLSLQTGVLAPAIATSMAFDPLASVVLGMTLLRESLDSSAVGVTVGLLALAAALAGLAALARTQEQGVATKPAQGTAAPLPAPAIRAR